MTKITITNILNDATKRLRRKSISYLDIERAIRYLGIDPQKEDFSKIEEDAIVQFLKVKIEKEKVVKTKALNSTLENKLEITTKQLQITNDRIITKLDEILNRININGATLNDSSFSVEPKKTVDTKQDPLISMFAEKNDTNK